MARPLRIEFKGGVYHVTARGNEKRDIFRDDKDYGVFLSILGKKVERFGVVIYCYVLMGNHYHLLVETPDANLSDFMHNLQSHYTNYFNRRHDRAGHLFQGRYKALIVDKESYLMELSRYIHLNPVRAGFAERPEQWKWSSYGVYASPRAAACGWPSRDEVLKCFGKDTKTAVRKYREFVLGGIGVETGSPLKNAAAQLILGPEEFVERIKILLKGGTGGKIDREISSGRKLVRWTPEEEEKAIAGIAEAFSTSKKNILEKGGHENIPREAAIYLFHRHSRWRMAEIGEKFGISGAAVCQTADRFERRLKKTPALAEILGSGLKY